MASHPKHNLSEFLIIQLQVIYNLITIVVIKTLAQNTAFVGIDMILNKGLKTYSSANGVSVHHS